MAFVKPLIRFGIVTVLAGGAAAAIVGPERLMAVAGQARVAVQDAVDQQVDETVRLRAQLTSLEAAYPEKIAAVNADLHDLRFQIGEMQQQLAVSNRVVELAGADFESLSDTIAYAETQKSPGVAVLVRFDSRPMDMSDAYSKANTIKKTMDAHAQQAGMIERDLVLLTQQESRLSELKARLESEQAEFQAEIVQLDQQIEMVARNDRLTAMLENYNTAYEDHNSFKGKNLDQVKGNIARILAEQETRLATLAGSNPDKDYAEQARYELDAVIRSGAPLPSPVKVIEPAPTNTEILEISPEDVSDKVARGY